MTTDTEIKPWRSTEEASRLSTSWDAVALADREIADLRTALEATQNELEEWRFTNKIDELQRALEAANTRIVDLTTAANMGNGELPRIPALPHALYEEYPAMSAKAHQDHVQDYARAYARAALAQRAGSGEVVAWRAPNGSIRENKSDFTSLGFKESELRSLVYVDAPPAAVQPDGMVLICKADANNYCRILTALGMEEEGDPVAAVEALVKQPDSGRDAAIVAVMACGYEGGMMVNEDLGGKITLHYQSPAEAENAFNAFSAALAVQPSEQAAIPTGDAPWISVLDRLPDAPLFLVRSTCDDDDESSEGVQQFEGMWVVRPGKSRAAMTKQIVIYVPDVTMADVMFALHERYPNCKVVTRWEPGAIMWQDALKEHK